MKKYFTFVAILALAAYWIYPLLSEDKILKYCQEHPEKKWSTPITYYIGLYQYGNEHYPSAIAAFKQVLSQNTTGQYAPSARFRLAQSYEEAADKGQAALEYQRFLLDYPEDAAAVLVKKRLEMLGVSNK